MIASLQALSDKKGLNPWAFHTDLMPVYRANEYPSLIFYVEIHLSCSSSDLAFSTKAMTVITNVA